jgi:hypothetical protein
MTAFFAPTQDQPEGTKKTKQSSGCIRAVEHQGPAHANWAGELTSSIYNLVNLAKLDKKSCRTEELCHV